MPEGQDGLARPAQPLLGLVIDEGVPQAPAEQPGEPGPRRQERHPPGMLHGPSSQTVAELAGLIISPAPVRFQRLEEFGSVLNSVEPNRARG